MGNLVYIALSCLLAFFCYLLGTKNHLNEVQQKKLNAIKKHKDISKTIDNNVLAKWVRVDNQ